MPYYRRKPTYKKKPFAKKRRGFGLDFQVGRGVPIVGGTRLRLGTRAVRKIARREIMAQEETKLRTFAISSFPTGTAYNTPLLNDTVYTYCPLSLIPQGDDVTERVGRQIFVRHVRFRIVTAVPSTANVDTTYRMLVIWSEQNYLQTGGVFAPMSSLVKATDLFQDSSIGTGASLHHALFDNKKNFKVICERKFMVKASNATNPSPYEREFNLECPIMQKVTMVLDTIPTLLKDQQLHLVLIPNQVGAATSTTHQPRVTVQAMVTYKDA